MVSADVSLQCAVRDCCDSCRGPMAAIPKPQTPRSHIQDLQFLLAPFRLQLQASICLSFGSSLSFTTPATLDFWFLWYISSQPQSYMWDTYFPSAHFQIRTAYLWLLLVAGGTSTLTHCSFYHPKRKHSNQSVEVFAFLLETRSLLHAYTVLDFAFTWKAWVQCGQSRLMPPDY